MLLYNNDNIEILKKFINNKYEFDCIYADCIYDNEDLSWLFLCTSVLKKSGIIFVQTDYHTVTQIKQLLDNLGLKMINWLIYKQEWGGVPKKGFPKKHDDILMYTYDLDNFKWYPDRIQIPKVTAGTRLDKKGTGLKTPCDVFDDLGNFSTIDKERVKMYNKNIQWQKPLKLMNRLLLPVTDEGDKVLDPFMGSGTTGVWCKNNNRDFYGIEKDTNIFNLAKERIENE
jgi:site-specific DNA-methyltransferase (adenine-specific)